MSATSAAALHGSFVLPVRFDLDATFAFALTGALAAIKRHYDIVGVLALALVTGLAPPAAVTFVFRVLTIAFNWRTAPVSSGSIFGNDGDPPTLPPALP